MLNTLFKLIREVEDFNNKEEREGQGNKHRQERGHCNEARRTKYWSRTNGLKDPGWLKPKLHNEEEDGGT
jgi:hypothetical protein